MTNEAKAPKGLFEKGIDLNKKLDKALLVGGAAIGLFFNPALGGAIVGGSLVSMEAGDRVNREIAKNRNQRAAKQLGRTATNNS